MKKVKPPLSSLSREEYEKRLNKILLAAIGKAWMYWPARAEVKRRCAVPGEPGWWYCEADHSHKVEVLDVDHIEPCVPTDNAHRNWHEYITRRFVFDAKKLQGLCKRCHRKKTKQEAIERKLRKETN